MPQNGLFMKNRNLFCTVQNRSAGSGSVEPGSVSYWMIGTRSWAATARAKPVWIQVFRGLPCGYRSLSTWPILHCLPKHVSRELDWKWTLQNSNWCPCGWWLHRQQFCPTRPQHQPHPYTSWGIKGCRVVKSEFSVKNTQTPTGTHTQWIHFELMFRYGIYGRWLAYQKASRKSIRKGTAVSKSRDLYHNPDFKLCSRCLHYFLCLL